MSFLQDIIDKCRAFSTVKVCVAAIDACHVGFGRLTKSQHPLICCFTKGALGDGGDRSGLLKSGFAPAWGSACTLDPGSGPVGNLCCRELVLAAHLCPVLHAGPFRVVCSMGGSFALIWPGSCLLVGGHEISLSGNTRATISHHETPSDVLYCMKEDARLSLSYHTSHISYCLTRRLKLWMDKFTSQSKLA